jgi:hypothetical protein
MDRAQIIDYTVDLVDEDTSIAPLLYDAINEGYMLLVTRYCPVYKSVEVDLYDGHYIEIPEDFNRLVSIESLGVGGNDYTNMIKSRGNRIYFNMRLPHQKLILTYSYIPDELMDNTDVPVIPKQYHRLISIYAAYSYLQSIRKFDRANYFYDRFMSQAALIDIETFGDEIVKDSLSANSGDV